MSDKIKTSYPCFVEMYNSCAKQENKDKIRNRYVLQLNMDGVNSEDIFSLLLLNGFVEDNCVEHVQFVSNCLKNATSTSCKELYREFGKESLLCELCFKNDKDVNKFKNQEFSLLLQCLVTPDIVKTIKEINSTEPIFRCIECDEVYLKSKKEGIMPAYAIPFTSLFFKHVIVSGDSKERFIEYLVKKYGEECRTPMQSLIDKLYTMKNGLTRAPLSNTKVTKIIEDIITYFYSSDIEKNKKDNTFAEGGDKVSKNEKEVKKGNLMPDSVSEEREIDAQTSNNSTGEQKEADFIDDNAYSAQENKRKDSDKEEDNAARASSEVENTAEQGIMSVEEVPKKILENERVVEDETDNSDSGDVNNALEKEAADKKAEFKLKTNGPVCTYESNISDVELKNFKKIDNKKDIEKLVNTLRADRFVACDYYKTEMGVDCVTFYLLSKDLFVYVPVEVFTESLLSVMRSQKIIKCVGKPWLLVDAIYRRFGVVLRNLYSMYTMTLITSTSLRFSIYDIVYNNSKIEDAFNSQLLYCLKNYKNAYDTLKSVIVTADKEKLLEIYSNFDIMLGCSIDVCEKKIKDRVLKFDDSGLYHIRNNEIVDKIDAVPFKLKFEVGENSRPDAIIAEVMATYVTSGCMTKCNLSLISKDKDSVIFVVEGEKEYEYVFEMLIYLSHLISYNKGSKCNIQFIQL